MSKRIKTIIIENGLNQKEFAKSINVTESYISKLLRDESGISNSTAALIERIYGYSAEWIQSGREPKRNDTGESSGLTPLQRRLIIEVEGMDSAELSALKAFIDSLREYQIYKCDDKSNKKRP